MLSPEAAKDFFKSGRTEELVGHKKKVHSVAWSCDGKRLASGSVDQTARIWNLEARTKDVELRGHTNSVDQLAWDPTSPEVLATASADKSVKFWDARVAKCISTVTTSGENINISWHPDGSHIAVGNKDDMISIIDTRKFKVLKSTKFPFEVNEITWNKSGENFLLTTGLGEVIVMKYPSMERMRTLKAHTANCYCIEYDPSGKYFAAGSADALVSLWDANELVCLRTFTKLDWPVRTISFSYDSQYIASASEDLVIDISEVSTGKAVYQIPCRAAMNTVAWHPSTYLLAFAGDEKDKNGRDEGSIKLFQYSSPSSTTS